MCERKTKMRYPLHSDRKKSVMVGVKSEIPQWKLARCEKFQKHTGGGLVQRLETNKCLAERTSVKVVSYKSENENELKCSGTYPIVSMLTNTEATFHSHDKKALK